MINLKSQISLLLQAKTIPPHPQSMHQSMSFVLVLAQFFGIMPVYGIRGRDYNSLRFKWKSLRYFYSVLSLFGAFAGTIFCWLQFFLIGFVLDKTATMSFYVCNLGAAFYFLKVARNWHFVIREWTQVENSMKSYGYPANLKRRFKIMTLITFILALVEHLLFVLNSLNSMWRCKKHIAKIYFTIAFPHVFQIISYDHWKAIVTETINIICTFWWNFIDLFIMLISSALALRFQQVSWRVKANSAGANEFFWKRIREDYNKLTHLCLVVDKHIGMLVGISFVSNLFFICIQLYNSLKPRYGIMPTIYFFYSFGFLLARTLAVSIYGAWIHDESRKPLFVLHSIPSEYYCIEIERFILQIHTNPNGLSGLKFFFVSRAFILRLAGTIVTFELMLLQFGPLLDTNIHLQVNHQHDYVDDCKVY